MPNQPISTTPQSAVPNTKTNSSAPATSGKNLTGISSLIDYLSKSSPQRMNRYQVAFLLASSKVQGPQTFFATMVQIPSRSIQFYPDSVGPYTPTWKVPLKQEFDDKFIIEFLVDENFQIRKFIEDWMDNLVKNVNIGKKPGNFLFDPGVETTAKMTITPLDSNGNVATAATAMTLYNAWPKLILPSEFNMDSGDLLRMQVDFNYRYMSMGTTTSPFTL